MPELAADDQLMGFWRYLARDDVLSVSYEQFAVGLDEKFGQSLWSEFPEIANKGWEEREREGERHTYILFTVLVFSTDSAAESHSGSGD